LLGRRGWQTDGSPAGRIATELNQELVKALTTIRIEGVELFVETVKDYRFVFVMRGEGWETR